MKQMFVLVMMICFLSGCGGKIYLADRPRVDQEVPGVSVQEDTRSKTRKVLVVQFTQKGEITQQETQSTLTTKQRDEQVEKVTTKEEKTIETSFSSSLHLPMGITPSSANTPIEEFQIYVVEKDDTLQKISKKFYGSYHQWLKIYEYNRDVIADPHMLKQGKKIKIPQLTPASK